MKIAVRRILRSVLAKSSLWGERVSSFCRRKIGIRISLDTMIDSATEATITIAVAAEKPPMKVISETTGMPLNSGSCRT